MGPFLHSLIWWKEALVDVEGEKGSHRSVCAAPRWSSQRGRGGGSRLPNLMSSRRGRKTKPALRELSDRYRYSWQGGCETIGWPSPRWLARSQHHLWLGVHLFRITVPPLDLQLADEGQLSENDTEFEDTSWKNTLLMQLRFPCVTDKCNRTRMTDQLLFPLKQQNMLAATVLRDKDKSKPFGHHSRAFHFRLCEAPTCKLRCIANQKHVPFFCAVFSVREAFIFLECVILQSYTGQCSNRPGLK